jgi:threonine dehydrogenase-like Zn-dependent dehydrogenase
MGIVDKVGAVCLLLKRGEPFNVTDERCGNCEVGKTVFCTGINLVGFRADEIT